MTTPASAPKTRAYDNAGSGLTDAPVETHDGVTTDGHGKLLGGQGSEPLSTPPPAAAPEPHSRSQERRFAAQGVQQSFKCEGCGSLIPAREDSHYTTDGVRLCGKCWMEAKSSKPDGTPPYESPCCRAKVMRIQSGPWFCMACQKPLSVKPEGTPVKRWLTHDEVSDYLLSKNGAEATFSNALGKIIERLCALLDEKEERIDAEIERNGETCKIADKQRTRAEKAEAALSTQRKAFQHISNRAWKAEADLTAARKAERVAIQAVGEWSRKCGTLEAREAKLGEALTGLLVFHPDNEFGAELPKEYWMPAYRSAVEKAAAALAATKED